MYSFDIDCRGLHFISLANESSFMHCCCRCWNHLLTWLPNNHDYRMESQIGNEAINGSYHKLGNIVIEFVSFIENNPFWLESN